MRGARSQKRTADRIASAGLDVSQVSVQASGPIYAPTVRVPADVTLLLGSPPVIRWPAGCEDVKERRSAGLLEAFIGLKEASDEQVLQFAKSWGPLGMQVEPEGEDEEVRLFCTHFREPVEIYRDCASKVLSLLLVAAHVRERKVPQPDLWMSWVDVLGSTHPITAEKWEEFRSCTSYSIEAEMVCHRRYLELATTRWVWRAGIRPWVLWRGEDLTLTFNALTKRVGR
jgi:hypothetical protein